MKKRIAASAVCAAAILLSTAVNAAESETDVLYSSEPEFTVMIPCDTEAVFSAEMTELGFVGLSDARLGADMSVVIRLSYSGRLKNRMDKTKTIAYRITEQNGRNYLSGCYLSAGDSTRLFISIKDSEWEKSFSGDYSDTMCFDISYEKTNSAAEVKT